jgi:hypothetical protein
MVAPGEADLMREYLDFARFPKPVRSELRGGLRPAHIRFANADTDEKLIEFVRSSGPVNGLEVLHQKASRANYRKITVAESLRRLRRERALFAAAVRLAIEFEKGRENDPVPISNALGDVTLASVQPGAEGEEVYALREWNQRKYIAELQQIAKEAGWQGGIEQDRFFRELKSSAIRDWGSRVLCKLLSDFPPVLMAMKQGIVEVPFWNPKGILSALYFMLRRDILAEHAINLCARRDCGQFFKVERHGQRFCSTECSQLQRQREYWERRGKLVRKRGLSKRRASKRR